MIQPHKLLHTISSSDTATKVITRTSSNTPTQATGTSQQMSGASIDTNVCCMCFGNYKDDILDGHGAEWIRNVTAHTVFDGLY